jgi:ABC-2 type transport system permease protein
MAVYDHAYRPYSGALTPARSRFLIIPRYALRDIFQSKLFTAFFALCFGCPLVMAILIYLHHNVEALKILQINLANVVPIDGSFFLAFFSVQHSFALFLTILIGPVLISRDVSNNALPLYLCRPFSRAEYLAGKMNVLAILISAITWVPGLLLFLFQSYLEGAGWLGGNLWIAGAIVASSLAWIVTLTLLAMALSAWVKWRLAASCALFAVFMIPGIVALMINQLFRTWVGNIFSLSDLMRALVYHMFREVPPGFSGPMPALALWVQWAVLFFAWAVCLFVLTRKVRAYEVVR